MIERGYQARTINIMGTTVKRMCNSAVKQRLLRENPIRGVEYVGKDVNMPDNPPPRFLPWEKTLKYLDICRESPPLGDMSELMLLTGMRVGEVVRMTWGDVDLEHGSLRLKRHKTSARTGRPRTIPLCARIPNILAQYAPEGQAPKQPVFRGTNEQRFTAGALRCRLRRLRKKHPELREFTFHNLRHTCATRMAREKIPELVALAAGAPQRPYGAPQRRKDRSRFGLVLGNHQCENYCLYHPRSRSAVRRIDEHSRT